MPVPLVVEEAGKESATTILTLFVLVKSKIQRSTPKGLLKRGDALFEKGLDLYEPIQKKVDAATKADFQDKKRMIEEMREEAEKKASFLYMGNHRDLLRDIKAFESFCRKQSQRWRFEAPAKDSEIAQEAASSPMSPSLVHSPSVAAPITIETPTIMPMITPLVPDNSPHGSGGQSKLARDYFDSTFGKSVTIQEVNVEHRTPSGSSTFEPALEISISAATSEAYREFCAIPPNEVANLPRATLMSLLTRMQPGISGLESVETWELVLKALAVAKQVKSLRDMLTPAPQSQGDGLQRADPLTPLIDL